MSPAEGTGWQPQAAQCGERRLAGASPLREWLSAIPRAVGGVCQPVLMIFSAAKSSADCFFFFAVVVFCFFVLGLFFGFWLLFFFFKEGLSQISFYLFLQFSAGIQ